VNKTALKDERRQKSNILICLFIIAFKVSSGGRPPKVPAAKSKSVPPLTCGFFHRYPEYIWPHTADTALIL